MLAAIEHDEASVWYDLKRRFSRIVVRGRHREAGKRSKEKDAFKLLVAASVRAWSRRIEENPVWQK